MVGVGGGIPGRRNVSKGMEAGKSREEERALRQ